MDPVTIALWEDVTVKLVALGVKSFSVIRAAMADAGHDEDAIALLAARWDALVADVARAAGETAGS